jgi:hypothetical protein
VKIGDVVIAPATTCWATETVSSGPAALVEEVVEKAETAIATENLVRKAILAGIDPQQAYLRFGKF